MTFPDDERRRHVEQEIELALLMDFLLTDRVKLLSDASREKLQGAEVKINDLQDTSSGRGAIQEVDFTIHDGTTFMWDRRFPAAIAYGRIKGQRDFLLAGAIFYPSSLRKAGIDPNEVDLFPALISDVPGHFNQFDNSLGFYIRIQPSGDYHLTFGGEHPESLVSRQISGSNKAFQIARALNTAVRTHVPRI